MDSVELTLQITGFESSELEQPERTTISRTSDSIVFFIFRRILLCKI
jgi:hypothetical protein